jgi:hypothetical protein
MAYANISDVAAMNLGRASGLTFTPSSRPTASQVGLWLDGVSAQLDAILRTRGYVVPVASSATSTRLLLQDAAMKGAHALVEIASPNDSRAKAAAQMWVDACKVLETAELDAPIDETLGGGVPQYSVAAPLMSIASMVPVSPGAYATGDV